MSAHDGSQTNPIDVRALRERLRREHPSYTTPRRRRARSGPAHSSRDRWLWWPATVALAAFMLAVFVLTAVTPAVVEHERNQRHLIRWCISCHGSIEIRPEVDR